MDALLLIALLLGIGLLTFCPKQGFAETLKDNKTVRLFIPIAGVEFAETEEEGEKVITSRIQVCRTGHWFHPWYGEFDITAADHRKMKKNHKNSKRRVVVDYQHNSTHPDPEWAVAAGWVVEGADLILEEDGNKLLADIEWTQRAIDRIKAKEYQFISPEIDFAYIDPETGDNVGATLLAIGLTNRPFLEGMDPVTITATEPVVMGAVRFAVGHSNSRRYSGGSEMNEDQVRELLGLAAGTKVTLAHWKLAATKLNEKVTQADESEEESESDDPSGPPQTPVTAAIKPDTTGNVVLSANDYQVLLNGANAGVESQKALRKMHIDKLIDEGLRTFRIVPAQVKALRELAEKDFNSAKAVVDSNPEGLFRQLTQETGSGVAGEDAGGETPEDKAVAVFRKHRAFYEGLGHKEEDARKYPLAFL